MIILCCSRAGGTRECRGHRVEDAGRGLAGATVRPGSRVWPAAHWDYREDGGVLPCLLGRRAVGVRRHERALLDGLQPVAVHVAEVQLAVRGPGNLLVRLERDDLGGDAVQPGG